MSLPKHADHLDWRTIRDTIDLTAVATELLGPPPGRHGERGSRSWWNCPFHDDKNPSFTVHASKGRFRCFGCGAKGDAAELVMKFENIPFLEAVRRLGGDQRTSKKSTPSRRPQGPPRPTREFPPTTSGLPREAAERVVVDAVATLWSNVGRSARRYLRERRFLEDETIRAAKLGVVSSLSIPRENKGAFHATGIVIPRFDRDGRLAKLNIRRADGRIPKYYSAFEDSATLGRTAFALGSINHGLPLIIVEGELDCLLLAQELGELANVVTLCSASIRPTPEILMSLRYATPWFVAIDADSAGEKAATEWPKSATRVRPPEAKDWTEARAAGVNLREFWALILKPQHLAHARPSPSMEALATARIEPDPITVERIWSLFRIGADPFRAIENTDPADLPTPSVLEVSIEAARDRHRQDLEFRAAPEAPPTEPDSWRGGSWSRDGRSWTEFGHEWLPTLLDGP